MEPLARTERAALADTLLATDPDAPTLCEGWTARDLAAHVCVRERRPDSALGVVVKPLEEYGERVRREYAAKPYPQLVDLVRTGPPTLSPFRIPFVDRAANGVELFIHHEDVRRGEPGWEPRDLPAAAEDELWARLRGMARLSLRGAPCGVVLRRVGAEAVSVRDGEPVVTITGQPSEIALFLYGRQDHARVEVEGDAEMVQRLRTASLGV